MDRRLFIQGALGTAGAGALSLLNGSGAGAAGWTNPQDHAFALAKTRIGAPYVAGRAGDWAFDCSGLIMWSVLRATGIALDKTAQDQVYSNIPSMHLQRVDSPAVGDLVYFAGHHAGRVYWYHCGFYAGGSSILHAPDVGQRVSYGNINIRDSHGAMAKRAYMRVTRGTVDYWNARAQHLVHKQPYHY